MSESIPERALLAIRSWRYRKPLLAFLVVALAALVVSFNLGQRTSANADRIALNQQRSCVRAQVQLANDNRSHRTDYEFFRVVIADINGSATLSKELYRVLHVPPRDVALATAANEGLVARLKLFADQKTWIPLSSCSSAGGSQAATSTFVAPQAIPFSREMPPPSDLAPPTR